MPSWGLELEVHSLQVSLEITHFSLDTRTVWRNVTAPIQIGPTRERELLGLSELYRQAGIEDETYHRKSVYNIDLGPLRFGVRNQHEISISVDHGSYERSHGGLTTRTRILVPEFIMRKPFGVGPDYLATPVALAEDYLNSLHSYLVTLREMHKDFSCVLTNIPAYGARPEQTLRIKGRAHILRAPVIDRPLPIYYSQITTAIDLTRFYSVVPIPKHADPIRDLYVFGQRLNKGKIWDAVRYEFSLLQRTRRIMRLALEQVKTIHPELIAPGIEWIAGGIGMAVFTTLTLVLGIRNPAHTSAKNLWCLMPKSSALSVLHSVRTANIPLYSVLFERVVLLLTENFHAENHDGPTIQRAKERLTKDTWGIESFEHFTPLLPVVALLHLPLSGFISIPEEFLTRLNCPQGYFNYFRDLARKNCDDTRGTTAQPGIGRPMFELRTHFIGARAPLLPADSRVLIDICNRLTTPCVTIPPRPAHPLSDDGRTVDTMRPYSPPSRDFWIPGIREMGHRILEEVDTDPEDARVFKRARRETPPPTPPNAPPPPDEETDLP